MKRCLGLSLLACAFLCGASLEPGTAADAPADWAVGYLKAPMGPIKTDRYHATFIKMGRANGLLYQPEVPSPNAKVAIVYTSSVALFDFSPAAEMASRGYRVLLVQHYLEDWRGSRQVSVDGFTQAAAGIAYMRAIPGVERVVLMGHDVGGHMTAFYAAAAEQGAAICQNPALLLPCNAKVVANLAKPDGLVLLDPDLGALTTASGVDPTVVGDRRAKHDVDMYAAANGYNAKTGSAKYSADFVKRFYAAQSARNEEVVDDAAARLKVIEQGKGNFTDDEPLTVSGAVNSGPITRLADIDLSLLSHTKAPHMLLKADGSTANVVITSVRAAAGERHVGGYADCCEKVRYTVKRFLGNDAVRTTPDFAVTDDDITGVDWKSSNTSTPANAENITVPTLVLATSCSSFVVPAEIVYDHLAAKDKTYVAVEGAGHDFTACKPQYGDTAKRTFDYLDGWLAGKGRF